jgi:hypothetical protein
MRNKIPRISNEEVIFAFSTERLRHQDEGEAVRE